MTSSRQLVVSGATGKQGGALIQALLANPSNPFEIYALTRNKNSKSAQTLASKPGVKVIEGDFFHPEKVFEQVPSPWGFFSMTFPMDMGVKKEEEQGKLMTKAAIAAGVQHIVFTATDRGGPGKSDDTATNIPHFVSKFNIEQDIEARARESKQGTTWTFLRPVAFFENLIPGFIGKAFVAVWRLNGEDRKLQMISTVDIGKIAADAFINAESDEYSNKAISLAGDELSPNDAARSFKEVTGQEIPWTYSWIGYIVRWLLWEQLGMMFAWFISDGFGADVKGLRKRYPFMQDFKTWLAEDSAWKKR